MKEIYLVHHSSKLNMYAIDLLIRGQYNKLWRRFMSCGSFQVYTKILNIYDVKDST